MKKLSAWILALSLALCAVPVFAESAVSLKPVEIPVTADTVLETRHLITVTAEWLASFDATVDDLGRFGDAGLKSETMETSVPAELLGSGGGRILSVSPDRRMVLLEYEGVPLLLKDGRLTMVSMDLTRCGASEQYGYQDSASFMSARVQRQPGLGRAGVIWMPDGRYALLSNASAAYMRLKDSYGLMWLDTETAEIFMAVPGGKLIPGNKSSGLLVQQAYGNTADGNLYCTVMGELDGKTAAVLRCYSPGTAESRDIAVFQGGMACEGMGIDRDGNLVLAIWIGNGKSYFYAAFSPENGTYTADPLPYWLSPVFLAPTPACTMLTGVINNPESLPVVLLRDGDGFSRLIVEDGAETARLETADPENPPAAEGLTILQAALDAGGARALLSCADTDGNVRFLLMDTGTLALAPVDISALEGAVAEKGAGFGYSSRQFLPGLHFTGGGSYVLIPFADGSTLLCALVSE